MQIPDLMNIRLAKPAAEIPTERLQHLRSWLKLITFAERCGSPRSEPSPALETFYTVSDELMRRQKESTR